MYAVKDTIGKVKRAVKANLYVFTFLLTVAT